MLEVHLHVCCGVVSCIYMRRGLYVMFVYAFGSLADLSHSLCDEIPGFRVSSTNSLTCSAV